MAEVDNTQPNETQPIKSKKDAFMERMKGRYPDMDFSDEENLYGKLSDEYDEFDKSNEEKRSLAELFFKDPRSANFLMVMRKGGNPMEFLIEQYGDDFREALDDPEKAKELSQAFAKYAEKQAKNKELQDAAEANMQNMLLELDAAQTEGKFTDEDARKAYEYLYADGGLLDRIITNEIHKDDWMMLMKAANYDAMQADAEKRVNEAREEGEIAGRNEQIDMNKKKRTKVESMPSNLTANGGTEKTEKPKDKFLETLDGITRRKSIWE